MRIWVTAMAAMAGSMATARDFAFGADLSFLRQAEGHGVVFKDGGKAKPGLRIFRDHGYNWIRLRLFVHPTTLPNDLAYTIATAKEAKAMGYKFLLDFHYADDWADPAHQPTPKAWMGLKGKALEDAVYRHTRDSIQACRGAGAAPDMVQLGNEVIGGMIWPEGRVPAHWDAFAGLVRAGVRGVDAASDAKYRPKIMIHIDRGGDQRATQWFFDKFNSYGIRYDVIGQSYYPFWHGSLVALKQNLDWTARTYKKDVMVVEVAYNWRPGEYLNRPGPFPESPEGQRDLLEEVTRVVLSVADGRGKGVFWWEPAVEGPLRRRGMFDDEGNALPVIRVFDKWSRN